MAIQQRFGLSFVAISCLALTACDFNDDDEPAPMPPADVSYSYEVTVYNMTQGQPLSPVGVALHGDGMMWEVGTSASQALEVLAEGGDNSDFTGAEGVMASATGAGPIAPGSSETITVTVINEPDTFISVATMLVNTNDAFAGVTGHGRRQCDRGEQSRGRERHAQFRPSRQYRRERAPRHRHPDHGQ